MTGGEFRHKAVYGFTGTGKSTLVKAFTKTYRRRQQQVIVYPGTGDTAFPPGCKFAWSADELEALLANPENYGAFVILDEGAALYDEVTLKKHPIVYGLFMRGRHLGYTCWIITQYPTSIPPRVRRNCTERYIFGTADEHDAQMIWQDCARISFEGKPLWQHIMQLKRYEFFRYIHPGEISKHVTRKG